jgi:hypothetical protein
LYIQRCTAEEHTEENAPKKAKDIASSETALQGGIDVGDEEAGVRAASAPGSERR